MNRKKVLEFLKDQKTLIEIGKEFGEVENLEQEILKWVDDSYIRLIEDDNEIFFETVNNEFTKKKVREIAQLSSYICTNPDCRRFTLAPSRLIKDKLINVGEAAHVYGSKHGSARFDPDLSSDEISNGIWLCNVCHKRIDSNNGIDYPAPTLVKWKEEHSEWLRNSLFKPYELIKGQDWLTYSEWKDFLRSHNKFLFKIDSYILKYSNIIISALEKSENNNLISIRILGPPNIGKKTILNEALENCSEEKKEQIFVYFKENESLFNKKFAYNTIIVIQECSNEFHSLLLKKLKFNGIINLILISLGSERDYKGTDKSNSFIIKIEGLNEYQTGILLHNINPSISNTEVKKIYEWSGGIPGLILDIYHLFKTEEKKLEKVEDYNHFWEEKLNQFIQKYSYPRNEALNLIIKISLLFRIPYSWDPTIFKNNYLPYLSGIDESLTQSIIRDLLQENLLVEKNGYLSIFPPLTSIYIIKEKVPEEDLIDFLIQIIKSKNAKLLDSFIQQVSYLDNMFLSNRVAYIIFEKFEYTVESLKDNFSVQALYRLSELFPNDILKIISKILSELEISDSFEVNNQIFSILVNLAEQSDLFFESFDNLLTILTIQWRTKNEINLTRLRDLFFKSDISFYTKIDYIDKIDVVDKERDYVILCLITTLINIYGVFPRTIIESNNYSEEETENFEKYKKDSKKYLSSLWKSLLKKRDLKNKEYTVLNIKKLKECFLPLYCTGLWKNLHNLLNEILEKYPDLKIDILNLIDFSLRFKSYSSEEDFNSLETFITDIKKTFNLIEELTWFIYYESIFNREPYDKDFEINRISEFVDKIKNNKENQETYIDFLNKQNNYKAAEIGADLAKIDKEFKLWSLIEKSFLSQLKNSSTDFLNGYTHIIFEKDKTLWDEILAKFEKIDELRPILYKILIPKLPYKKNLIILIELYQKELIPKEKLRTIIYSFRKEKVSKYSEEDLVRTFNFYFSEIENPLDGVELHYINEWLGLRDYLIPDQLKNQIVEILTSFEKINQYQFYLAPIWDDIINQIKAKDKKLYDKIRNRALEKLKDNLSNSLFNRLEKFLFRLLKEEYEDSIRSIKNLIIEIATTPSHMRYILQNLDIKLIKLNDIIDLCKTKKNSIFAWVIDNNIEQLIESSDIPEFFSIILDEFPYNNALIQLTYKSILRARDFNDEKEYLIYLYESKKHIETLLNIDLPKPIQFWLEGIIKKLESKINKISESKYSNK